MCICVCVRDSGAEQLEENLEMCGLETSDEKERNKAANNNLNKNARK